MKYLLLSMLLWGNLFAADPIKIPPPPSLEKGDLIALVFPASYIDLPDEEAKQELLAKSQWLQSQGYRTIIYPEIIERHGYLSGTDNTRASAFMDAWKDEKVKAIWCYRGGYGSERILDLLDYEYIQQHPKIFIGMSDITALHQAIYQKTGLITYLAPILRYFNEGEFDNAYAIDSLENTLTVFEERTIPLPEEIKILVPGKARGELVGGNLALISSMCGTQWQIDTEGKILILEDIGEAPYSIDRMLWQLREANLLKNPTAVMLGNWTDCHSTSPFHLTLDIVFEDYFSDAKYPVILNFPSGHDKYQATLPLHSTIEIDTDQNTIKMIGPISQKE